MLITVLMCSRAENVAGDDKFAVRRVDRLISWSPSETSILLARLPKPTSHDQVERDAIVGRHAKNRATPWMH